MAHFVRLREFGGNLVDYNQELAIYLAIANLYPPIQWAAEINTPAFQLVTALSLAIAFSRITWWPLLRVIVRGALRLFSPNHESEQVAHDDEADGEPRSVV